MDDWRTQQAQQQPPRMSMNQIGPIHSYHPIRSRPAPYQTYQYQPSPTIPVRTDSTPNVYNPHPYTPTHMDPRMIHAKSTYHSTHQPMMSARTRSMPYPTPSMYTHSSSNPICQCSSHMYYPSQHPMSYPSNSMKTKMPSKSDESFLSSTSYHPTVASNSYIPAQQLTPISQDYQTFSNQSQIFPSPPSNPSTPYQGEFNGTTEFGVPYHPGQPGSVNSLTDALCPSGDTTDRQMTPGPPSVGTPRVPPHQYSFPQTPSTPTTSRLLNEQNIDELTAFLQDPVNLYFTDDFTSTLFDDIEALADTYLGGGGGGGGMTHDQTQSNMDNNFDYDIILNYLCSDDLISTVCRN